MPHTSRDLVEIDYRSCELICKFPPNMRLHGAKYGIFKVRTGLHGRLVIRSDASSVLRDILERLQGELDDIVEITGDYMQLKIRLVCEAATDHVVRHIVLACTSNDLRPKYTGPQRLTVSPTYAI